MKVRKLAEQLTDLSRRGYGDDHVLIEVGGDGSVHVGPLKTIQVEPNTVVLSSEEEE